MADDIKKITFVEEPDKGFKALQETAHRWYQQNAKKVNILSGIYTAQLEVSDELSPDFRRGIVIRYTGDGGINPQECKHPHKKTQTVPATCQSDGVVRTECEDCGMYLGEKIIPKINHEYVYTKNNDATCTKDGTKTGKCKYCNHKITQPDPGTAHGHNYVFTPDGNATCTENGTETGRCSYGDADTITREIPNSALGHNLPNNWTVRVAPTESSFGVEFRKCTRCSYEETRQIAKLEHRWVSNNDGTHTCKTPGGCGASETCSPNTPGATCAKCGYITPSTTDFEITTEYINSMTVGQAFTQQITTNISGEVDWDLVQGSVPIGTVFYRTGILSGTPQIAGIYTFTIIAKYNGYETTKQFTVNVANVNYTVTFDAQEGNCSESSRQVAQGSTIGELPTCTRDGFEFGGWYTAVDGGMKVDNSYTVSSNVTLYARWGKGVDVEFSEPTSIFNIKYDGNITNFNDNPYTIYQRCTDGSTSNLVTQVGISSTDGTNNLTEANKKVVLYLKVTNNGDAGNFDIGFDADSKIGADDSIIITRIARGIRFGNVSYRLTVPYTHTAWLGKYLDRTKNRYEDTPLGIHSNNVDSGFAFTIKNVFINSGSYTILEITFERP